MQKHTSAVFLMLLCTVFASLGQLLWKLGVQQLHFSVISTFFNLPFLFGFLAYGIAAMLMILAFQRGELSVLYPIIATSYIWVSLFSPILFPGDQMNVWKWAGVIVILFSVSLLGWGSSKQQHEEVAHG